MKRMKAIKGSELKNLHGVKPKSVGMVPEAPVPEPKPEVVEVPKAVKPKKKTSKAKKSVKKNGSDEKTI